MQDAADRAPQRDPSLVFFAGIVGVPWQDIANNPSDLTQGYKTAAQLQRDGVWRRSSEILRVPKGPFPPPTRT